MVGRKGREGKGGEFIIHELPSSSSAGLRTSLLSSCSPRGTLSSYFIHFFTRGREKKGVARGIKYREVAGNRTDADRKKSFSRVGFVLDFGSWNSNFLVVLIFVLYAILLLLFNLVGFSKFFLVHIYGCYEIYS